MDYKINSTDFMEHLYSQPLPQPDGSKIKLHRQLGSIAVGTHQLPHIQALELDWQLPGNSLLLTETSEGNDGIAISFQLTGRMYSRFARLHHPLEMKAGTHNLVYLSGKGDEHAMEAGQQLSVFQVTVSRHYFMQCFDEGNPWSDDILNKADKNIPLAAVEKPATITPRMHQLIQSIKEDRKPGPMKKLLFQSRLLELLALQADQYSRLYKKESCSVSAADLHKLQELKQYLDLHFLEDLSLLQLSRISCLNEFKLKKGFKSGFGETVFGYIRKLRMNHAGRLLLDTTSTVDEVAATLGYEHAHHFSKAFKEYTGYPPSVYRRNG